MMFIKDESPNLYQHMYLNSGSRRSRKRAYERPLAPLNLPSLPILNPSTSYQSLENQPEWPHQEINDPPQHMEIVVPHSPGVSWNRLEQRMSPHDKSNVPCGKKFRLISCHMGLYPPCPPCDPDDGRFHVQVFLKDFSLQQCYFRCVAGFDIPPVTPLWPPL